jgi:hypothetical protein
MPSFRDVLHPSTKRGRYIRLRDFTQLLPDRRAILRRKLRQLLQNLRYTHSSKFKPPIPIFNLNFARSANPAPVCRSWGSTSTSPSSCEALPLLFAGFPKPVPLPVLRIHHHHPTFIAMWDDFRPLHHPPILPPPKHPGVGGTPDPTPTGARTSAGRATLPEAPPPARCAGAEPPGWASHQQAVNLWPAWWRWPACPSGPASPRKSQTPDG